MQEAPGSVKSVRANPPKRVLIVDDSVTVREYLRHVIDADEGLEVIGMAKDGLEAVSMVHMHKPDIVTMDIHMPTMNGLEATRRIMEECPAPIVIVTSSWDRDQARNTFRAMEAGALAALEKPPGPGHPKSAAMVAKLIETLKTMAEVRVVRRYRRLREQQGPAVEPEVRVPIAPARSRIELVAIGASTGGPPAIRALLSGLEATFPAPILIVQHITPGFLQAMVDWLNGECDLTVVVPKNGEMTRQGHVYFAPEGLHMAVNRSGSIVLSDLPAENGLKPSVSHLFRSVAAAYGPRAVGLLLTGMGKDGAMELKVMRDHGAVTVAQNKESCVVYGMPAEAVKLGAAEHVLSPEEMAAFLRAVVGRRDPASAIT